MLTFFTFSREKEIILTSTVPNTVVLIVPTRLRQNIITLLELCMWCVSHKSCM